jgi:hypothetical protein
MVALFTAIACTQNKNAKTFGGTADYTLPENTKLVNGSWKGEDLWLLTRPMRPEETAETYKMIEKSNFGVWEGTVVIKEVKK